MSQQFDKELAAHKLRIERTLPGAPIKDSKGKVPFYTARILNQSDRLQWAEVKDHPEHKLVFFAGDTFMWWCERCRTTIWEQECQLRFVRSCTFCNGRLLALSPGDWIKMHYPLSRAAGLGDVVGLEDRRMRFAKGDRVKLSESGLAMYFGRSRPALDRSTWVGTVTGHRTLVRIKWDHLKTHHSYHPDFIVLESRP